VYADELRAAAGGRICNVPYDATVGVSTVWDLGWGDSTAIWFVQRVAFETRFIDFYENSRQSIEHYLKVCQEKGYLYDTFWLPHDARSKSLGTGRSIEEIIRNKGNKVRIVPKLSLVDGINAGRTIFPNCYFDKEKCADGIQALRHYRYELVEDPIKKIFTRTPVHDWTSHAADAFRYSAIAVRQPSNTLLRVSHALLKAQEKEEGLFARLARFGGGNNSSTGWMK
jgi:phage terminase large subunit